MCIMIENQNFEFVVNHRHFITAVVSIMDMLKEKSAQLIKNCGNKTKQYERLYKTCDKILTQYRSDVNDLNEGKIIKKVYKSLRSSISLLRNKDGNLFNVKDANNKITTILPGIDIGLIYNDFDDAEKTTLWQYMLLMFISSVKMVDSANKNSSKSEKTEEMIEILTEMEKELTKTGMTVKGMAFNPFVGLSGIASHDKLGIDDLFSGEEPPRESGDIGLPGVNINTILSSLGISQVFDVSKINEELKNITEEGVRDAVQNITKMIGAEDDSDVSEVCNDLITSILENLKENGVNDMMGTLQSITSTVTNKIDPTKMKKTAVKMNSFMQGSVDQFKNMKDDAGNPIGDKLLSAMENPLKMLKQFNGGNLDLNLNDTQSEGTQNKKASKKSKKSKKSKHR